MRSILYLAFLFYYFWALLFLGIHLLLFIFSVSAQLETMSARLRTAAVSVLMLTTDLDNNPYVNS